MSGIPDLRPSRDWVALILAIGLSTALNLVVVGVMWDAVRNPQSVLSENATQILTGWGGGIIGVLGAVFGYRAGAEAKHQPPDEPEPEPPAPAKRARRRPPDSPGSADVA